MNIKKGKVNNEIVDVITSEEYFKNPTMYDTSTAVQIDNYLLPIRKTLNRDEVAFYPHENYANLVLPKEKDKDLYSANQVIDFSDKNNFKEIIEKTQKLKNMEREILTSPDNIYEPRITEKTSPEMRLFKEAVGLKKIDIDKYKSRIKGFANDKRILDNDRISFDKMKALGKSFDMKISLTIEDDDKDVPNPMGKKISTVITNASNED